VHRQIYYHSISEDRFEEICNRPGVLTGRLRGYDKEYELVKLIERTAKKKSEIITKDVKISAW